jgi:hypothetical protein
MTTLDYSLDAISIGLLSLRLLTERQMKSLLDHCAQFPSSRHHRLFLEFRVRPELELEGYGHGFDPHVLPNLVRDEARFAAADSLVAALAADPFRVDRQRFFDIGADHDPDWVGYDCSQAAITHSPGVFFSFPARFRRLSSADRLSELKEKLAARIPLDGSQSAIASGVSFWRVLEALLEADRGGFLLYRLGLSPARPPGWVRVIIDGIQRSTLAELQETLFSEALLPSITNAVDPALDTATASGRGVAVSITIVDGFVTALDLECPYFHKCPDTTTRRTAVGEFCDVLRSRGILATPVAEVLASAAAIDLQSANGATRGRVLFDHFKFGVAGGTAGRIKAYFELLLHTSD